MSSLPMPTLWLLCSVLLMVFNEYRNLPALSLGPSQCPLVGAYSVLVVVAQLLVVLLLIIIPTISYGCVVAWHVWCGVVQAETRQVLGQ